MPSHRPYTDATGQRWIAKRFIRGEYLPECLDRGVCRDEDFEGGWVEWAVRNHFYSPLPKSEIPVESDETWAVVKDDEPTTNEWGEICP